MNKTDSLSIPLTRFLDNKGRTNPHFPSFADKETLLRLYRWMMLTRLFDMKAVSLQRTGKLNTYASILGQEAVSVGIGASMAAEDVLCPYYRDYGAQLMRGVKMSEILSYWKGNEWGNHFRNCPNDFPICVPIATQLLHAAGVATAFKLRKQKRVVVTTCGDGATSKGDFYEALNIAGAWQLPIVFIINNNQWAISVSREQQTKAKTLAQKAIAAGIPGQQVDGNDVVAVNYVVRNAIQNARNNEGPCVIEALTYRLSDHTTADDATRYRTSEELKKGWENEPLFRLKQYLMLQKLWSDAEEAELKAETEVIISTAVNEYFSTQPPQLTDIFDYHYAHLPNDLAEQRIDAIALAKLNEIVIND